MKANPTKKYYKIVFFHGKSRLSYCLMPHNIRVHYKLGKWVKPKIANSRLFVFDSLDAPLIKNVRKGCGCGCEYYEIYECEIKNPDMSPMVLRLSKIDTENVMNFWRAKKTGEDDNKPWPRSYDPAPLGTVTASAVKLTKRIYP